VTFRPTNHAGAFLSLLVDAVSSVFCSDRHTFGALLVRDQVILRGSEMTVWLMGRQSAILVDPLSPLHHQCVA
jgi:hypothetical protein